MKNLVLVCAIAILLSGCAFYVVDPGGSSGYVYAPPQVLVPVFVAPAPVFVNPYPVMVNPWYGYGYMGPRIYGNFNFGGHGHYNRGYRHGRR